MSQSTSAMSTRARVSFAADVDSTADSAPTQDDSINARIESHSRAGPGPMSTASSAESPDAKLPDFSAEVIVTNRDAHVFTALRYHIERVRDPTDNASEVMVLGHGTTACRIVPLAMGFGTVRSPAEPDIGYDIYEDKISLMSADKRFVYDFVYEALDAYEDIKNPRETILN